MEIKWWIRTGLLLAPLLSACAIVGKLGETGGGGGGNGAPTALANQDCQAFGGQLPDLDAPREHHILAMACYARHDTPPDPGKRAYVRWHFGFDDRHFDPVLASMIVVNCASGDRCSYPYVVGQMAYYAQAKPEDVAAGLARMQLADEVKRAWVDRFRAAREEVLANAAAMSEEDAPLLRDLPAAVRAERAKYNAALADDLDAYDKLAPELAAALEAKRGDKALIARASTLRDRHVRRCVDATAFSTSFCWHGTIARPLTESIAWLAVYANDALTANLEEDTLGTGLDVTGAANHISMMQERARDIGQRYSWDPWSRLDGLKEEKRKALHERVYEMREGIDWGGEGLKSVGERGGGLATVNYEVRVSSSTGYECSKNIKLRAENDGSIKAYRKCRVSSHETERHVTKPVTVPAADARGLKKGNFVFTIFDAKTRRGRVVHARPTTYSEKDDLIRIRFTELKGKVDRQDQAAMARVGYY